MSFRFRRDSRSFTVDQRFVSGTCCACGSLKSEMTEACRVCGYPDQARANAENSAPAGEVSCQYQTHFAAGSDRVRFEDSMSEISALTVAVMIRDDEDGEDCDGKISEVTTLAETSTIRRREDDEYEMVGRRRPWTLNGMKNYLTPLSRKTKQNILQDLDLSTRASRMSPHLRANFCFTYSKMVEVIAFVSIAKTGVETASIGTPLAELPWTRRSVYKLKADTEDLQRIPRDAGYCVLVMVS
jgi:hypothetical protein